MCDGISLPITVPPKGTRRSPVPPVGASSFLVTSLASRNIVLPIAAEEGARTVNATPSKGRLPAVQ